MRYGHIVLWWSQARKVTRYHNFPLWNFPARAVDLGLSDEAEPVDVVDVESGGTVGGDGSGDLGPLCRVPLVVVNR